MKHCSQDQEHVLSVIPGIALNPADPHSFIQVIDGISGETDYLTYPLKAFQWDPRNFKIQVGSSTFSLEGISLNIKSKTIELSGEVSYLNPVIYPGTLFSPGIMGWYSYMPFMECYHGIVSANHILKGNLKYTQKTIDFSGG